MNTLSNISSKIAEENNAPDLKKLASMQIDKNVGVKIKLLRNIRNLRQSDVARELGITFQQYQKYETGKNRTPLGRLVMIAALLKVQMNVFFENNLNVQFEENANYVTSNTIKEPFIIPNKNQIGEEEKFLAIFRNISDPDKRRKFLSIMEDVLKIIL